MNNYFFTYIIGGLTTSLGTQRAELTTTITADSELDARQKFFDKFKDCSIVSVEQTGISDGKD